MSFISHKSRALDTIARLSAKPGAELDAHLRKLGETCRSVPAVSQVPMTAGEYSILVALCKIAPDIKDRSVALRLLGQLTPYLTESFCQKFDPAPSLLSISPSPWEALTYHLTSAVLCLGIRHPELHERVHDAIYQYSRGCCEEFDCTSETEPQKGAVLSVSLLGFTRAASSFTGFWGISELLQMIDLLRDVFVERVLVSVEGIFSSIRTSGTRTGNMREWKVFGKKYAASGRPLGAMLLQHSFMQFLHSCSALMVVPASILQEKDTLDALLSQKSLKAMEQEEDTTMLVKVISDIATEQIRLLNDGADFLHLSSSWQQKLGFAVKALSLSTFLSCSIADADIADFDLLVSWLDETIADPIQIADEDLASVVLRIMNVTARMSSDVAVNLSRSLPKFIVQGGIKGDTVKTTAITLTSILHSLSQDAIMTSLYSLGNVLSDSRKDTSNGAIRFPSGSGAIGHTVDGYSHHSTGSAISLDMDVNDDPGLIYGNVVQAVVIMASACQDEKVAALALSMLLQKLGRINTAVDIHIISETAMLAAEGTSVELRSLLKLYSRLCREGMIQNNRALVMAISKARLRLAAALFGKPNLYETYLIHLLESIVSRGDVHEGVNTHEADVEMAAREIVLLIEPLVSLLECKDHGKLLGGHENLKRLYREIWFNMVVHGITPHSSHGQQHRQHLKMLASNRIPLVTEEKADQHESDIDLNSVLQRGMNAPHTAEQKRYLTSLLPSCESDIRSLSYAKVNFLIAFHMVETFRAETGDCTTVLQYFRDPSVDGNATEHCMTAISGEVLTIFIKSLNGSSQINSAPRMAEQLVKVFSGCCHSNIKVQQISIHFADKIIGQNPTSLCQKASLFALLELLSMMWTSCLESELDDYSWKSHHLSKRGNVSVELSDDFHLRRRSLDALYLHARKWVTACIGVAPMDVKALLQTYLSDFDDGGAFGHIALGRSFAIEMGAAIPLSDHKLAGIDSHGTTRVDTASDFIAQYTTRQEYRYANTFSSEFSKSSQPPREVSIGGESSQARRDIQDAGSSLAEVERKLGESLPVSLPDICEAMRSAAAVLCRSESASSRLLQQLVKLPFVNFTKTSVKFGISLWMGIINERAYLEPRIIAEIGANLEKITKLRRGAFNSKLRHLDPFYIREEFAPSDKSALLRQQLSAHTLITPNLRILQFLTSHFNVSSCGSFHTQRMFYRIASSLLHGLKRAYAHPLAREWFFQVVLFGLSILRFSVGILQTSRWRLKDLILTAALKWFAGHSCWSFGGNRLQVKAEVQILNDVVTSLRVVSATGQQDLVNLRSLTTKQNLLISLIDNEQARLHVWLYPLEPGRTSVLASISPAAQNQEGISTATLKAAWLEGASLAIQIADRFSSWSITRELRNLLLKDSTRAIDEPQALKIMLSSSIPADAEAQMKYLLFWTSVDPITAVTYFLPEYRNHPILIQYAMRALQSHAVEVTFFYVPQIVQALRYDALGYVQRYIVETAKFSQLFAHQIIWNMKANAYKDEDSTVEDPLKPVLDNVTDNMLITFSGADKAFYEREFSFFNEITDISGKLRPFIKRSKPEKKQKIEEELRKIKVDVGVYLPSNPDGTVIGIDRKSGKPLQSHAKAPYMATFRIKKSKAIIEGAEDLIEGTNKMRDPGRDGHDDDDFTYEAWQSAIFKVGDDCRQDVLVLQIIAAFRGIFNNVGLDVYVYPYRVTATAPGCGVIDVLPNSISRDMLGREAVNGLYEYFVSKYGAENSVRFQEARNNFVKSMAAYSVISYLLQLKDRHNGNIMVDDAGHILHIDFGFCFDIAPGGVRFERAPFKLTSEMVSVMGGTTTSQSYVWFEELCVKAFLASRPHADKICHLVTLMLDSGLPCFKPQTINHLRQRFVLDKSERDAATFMKDLIKKSHSNYSTKGYDQFQLLTNGIPY